MNLNEAAIIGIPLVVAITMHEAAHGFIAYVCGDVTAKRMGRMTLNPLKHVDLLGTVLIPAALIFLKAPFMFGYAKPVPINPNNFFHRRSNLALVALAGPLMNVLLAMVSYAIYIFIYPDPPSVVKSLIYSIQVNFVLAVFNMLPMLPLDGGRILSTLLPSPWDKKFLKLEPVGLILILGLMVLPSIANINPIGWFVYHGVEWLRDLLGVTL